MSRTTQTAIGLGLAAGVICAWAAVHVWGVFFHPFSGWGWVAAPVMILAQSWLGTGLFIVAHDAMHGSLAPGRPRVNAALGQLALGLYAAFDYRALREAHHAHHRAPGTEADPDFHAARPTAFGTWYVNFFRTYFGLREFAAVTAVLCVYLFALGASPLNAAMFWGLPAILSSLQLFYFGTYLPHRHDGSKFADRHNARTIPMPTWLSLLTCFHFGRHHEHHLSPSTPWWRLATLDASRLR
jgi:beta-carotene ketolase (CrtW type)